MTLKELKEKIDKMYEKYGEEKKQNIYVNLNLDYEVDDTIIFYDKNHKIYPINPIENGYIDGEEIADVSEMYDGDGNFIGICLSNYIMEEK